MHFVLRTLLLLNVSWVLTGCLPVIVGGGVLTTGYMVIRDKSVGESLSDTKLEAAIKARLYKANKELYSNVSVNVSEGCVLLTGVVRNQEWISISEKESWAVNGVKVVDNNITSGEELGVSQIMKDGVITSSCRASLLVCAGSVKSLNYKLKTMNGVVYVTGTAKSDEELNVALSKIQKVNGVKKVVSYVNVIK